MIDLDILLQVDEKCKVENIDTRLTNIFNDLDIGYNIHITYHKKNKSRYSKELVQFRHYPNNGYSTMDECIKHADAAIVFWDDSDNETKELLDKLVNRRDINLLLYCEKITKEKTNDVRI